MTNSDYEKLHETRRGVGYGVGHNRGPEWAEENARLQQPRELGPACAVLQTDVVYRVTIYKHAEAGIHYLTEGEGRRGEADQQRSARKDVAGDRADVIGDRDAFGLRHVGRLEEAERKAA